jgi:cation diffusion facilitator CzcD-associated flavoprotein CzcO
MDGESSFVPSTGNVTGTNSHPLSANGTAWTNWHRHIGDQAMQRVRVIIVGAGPAGLATAACLGVLGEEAVVLERAATVGAVWRSHYDRLHLHTPGAQSGLPHWPMPLHYPRYPSRDQFIAYLEDYAAHFRISPRFGEEVVRIFREGAWHRVQTNRGSFLAQHVVVATGYTRVPRCPTFRGQDGFSGEILHSAQYRNGSLWRGRRVLVVGFGNSGGEIAIDLHEHGARPTLAVRGPVNVIPREVLGVPVVNIGIALRQFPATLADALARPMARATLGNVSKLGLKRLPYGPNRQLREHGRIPLIDVGTIELIRRGAIDIRPGIERFTENAVLFTDGRGESFDAVVLATGFRPALEEILKDQDILLDDSGAPEVSGKEVAPGLHVCGFYVSPHGMLREISFEARKIAAAIHNHSLQAETARAAR